MERHAMKKRKRNPQAVFAAVTVTAVSLALIVAIAGALNKKAPDEPLAETTETPTATTVEPVTLAVTVPEFEPEPDPEPVVEYISLGEFTLTAYCPCVKCCGEWSAEHPSRIGTDYVQKTASGTIPIAGRTVSVDTSVIPFGSIVVINGHEYVAEDRGGAIKGNKVDVYFDSHDEALEFGRQMAEVFIKTIKEG